MHGMGQNHPSTIKNKSTLPPQIHRGNIKHIHFIITSTPTAHRDNPAITMGTIVPVVRDMCRRHHGRSGTLSLPYTEELGLTEGELRIKNY